MRIANMISQTRDMWNIVAGTKMQEATPNVKNLSSNWAPLNGI